MHLRGSEFLAHLASHLLRKRGQSFDDVVTLRHIENPLDPFGVVLKVEIGLYERLSLAELSARNQATSSCPIGCPRNSRVATVTADRPGGILVRSIYIQEAKLWVRNREETRP